MTAAVKAPNVQLVDNSGNLIDNDTATLTAAIAAIIAGSSPAYIVVTNPDRASIFAEQAFNAQAAADDATVAGLSQVTSLGFEAQLVGFTGILTAWSTLDGTTKLAQLRFKKEGTVVNEINSTAETANYSCEFEDNFMHQVILSMTRTAGSVSATIFGKGV